MTGPAAEIATVATFAAGLIAGLAAWRLWQWLSTRRSGTGRHLESVRANEPWSSSGGAVGGSREPGPSVLAPVEHVSGDPSLPNVPSTSAAPTPNASSGGGRGVSDELVRTSHRIVLHLAVQGRLGPEELATYAFTQGGIASSLGKSQSTVAKSLRRLEGAGVIDTRRGHVIGEPQRLKVYRLTPLGESLAREVRSDLRRRPQAPPPGDESPPVHNSEAVADGAVLRRGGATGEEG